MLDDRRGSPDAPRPGPLGRLAGLAYRRRGTRAHRLGRGARRRLRAVGGLRRRVHQRLLRAGLGLRAGTEPAGRAVPGPVRRHGAGGGARRRRHRRRRARCASTRCSPSWDACRTSTSVEDPYATEGSVTPDGRTLVARVYLDVTNPNDMPVEATERLLAAAAAAERDGLDDRARWAGRATRRGEPAGSEMIGLLAAAVILLVMFGSVVAAGLPLAMAIGGLAVSSSLVGLAAAVVDVPDFAPIIGVTLGIALGIDYALLMVTRFREWRAVGTRSRSGDRGDARHRRPGGPRGRRHGHGEHVGAVRGGPVHHERHRRRHHGRDAGRDGRRHHAVPRVAGLPGPADRPAPDTAGTASRRPGLRRRPPGARRPAGRGGAGWCGGTACSPPWRASSCCWCWPCRSSACTSACPTRATTPRTRRTGRRTTCWPRGSAPAPTGRCSWWRTCPRPTATAALQRLQADLGSTAGVAAVSPPRLNPAGDTALITVVPTTGPQEAATEDLVKTLRDDVIPAATDGTGTRGTRRRYDRGDDRRQRARSPTGSRCSSAASSSCRCCCCWWRSAASSSRSRRP